MFDEQNDKNNKDGRSRIIMIVSGLAVVAVLALIIMVASLGSKKPEAEPPMARPGSSEFDSYAQFIKIDIRPEDKSTNENLLGNRFGIIKATVQNTGDRALVGLQLRAVALGFGSEPLRELVVSPVPRKAKTLGPQQALSVEVQLERIPDPDTIMDMTIELYALKLN